MFIILKTDYFQLWVPYKSDLRISPAGKQGRGPTKIYTVKIICLKFQTKINQAKQFF